MIFIMKLLLTKLLDT